MVFIRIVIILFTEFLWHQDACGAEIDEPRFTDVLILGTTSRLIICEFFPEAEQQLLFASRDDTSPYIVIEAMNTNEIIVDSVMRKKLCERYKNACFMNGNVRLPILDKDHHLVGLYSFLFPDKKNYCEVVFYLLPQYRGLGYMPEVMMSINELVLRYIEKPTYWPKRRPADEWDQIQQMTEQQLCDQFDMFFQFKPKVLRGIYAEVLLSNKSSLIANIKAKMIPGKYDNDDTWWGEICFYFPAKQEDPVLTEVVKRIAYSTCTEDEEVSIVLAKQQINTFSFISSEIAVQAVALLESENLKQNISTLKGIPLSLLAVYRITLKNLVV